MGELLEAARSRGLGRIACFCIGLAISSGDPVIAVMGVFCDVVWAAIDAATLRRGTSNGD